MNDSKYEESAKYAALVESLIPDNDVELMNTFMYWTEAREKIIESVDDSL